MDKRKAAEIELRLKESGAELTEELEIIWLKIRTKY